MTTQFRDNFIVAVFFCLALYLTSCDFNPGKTKSEKIDYLIEKAVEDHKFIGSALVMDEGKVIFQKSYGKAITRSATTDSTKFLIASLSKTLTATLVLKLADQEKIKLTDSLDKFLPITKGKKVGAVTIHQLLTHTSGIRELISKDRELTDEDLTHVDFKFEPGSDFDYSNSGYVLLKKVAEVTGGKPYKELMQELIFSPLEMKSSGVAENLSSISSLAMGYKDATQQEPDPIDYSLRNVDGAGSIYSTAADLFRFTQGIGSTNFLSKSMQEQMFAQQVKEKFGYGWYLRERGGVWDVAYHKGDLPGFTSFISRRSSNNQVIVLLANATSLDLSDLESDIAKVLRSED